MKTVLAVSLALALPLPALAGPPAMPAFSADQTTIAGGQQQEGKIYSSGSRLRTERAMGGQTSASIFDLEQKKMWLMMPPPVGCLEQSVGEETATLPVAPKDVDWKEELVGEETVDGHPTKKYRITTTGGGESHVVYQWKATDLQGIAIRMTDEKGTFEQRLSNVELGQPDAKLFETPANCGNLGDLMKGMGKPPAR